MDLFGWGCRNSNPFYCAVESIGISMPLAWKGMGEGENKKIQIPESIRTKFFSPKFGEGLRWCRWQSEHLG